MFAATVACDIGIADVSTLTGADNCYVGELTFGDFSVFSSIGGTIGINGAPFTADTGGNVNLNFEFNPQGPGPANYTWQYSVTANEGFELIGLDATLGVGDPIVQMTEIGCLVDPLFGCTPETNLLGSLVVDNDLGTVGVTNSAVFWFEGTDTLWVKKDLTISDGSYCGDTLTKDIICESIGGTPGFISDITNSHHYQRDGDVPEVPEPATMLLFSSALLGLGYMRRKKS